MNPIKTTYTNKLQAIAAVLQAYAAVPGAVPSKFEVYIHAALGAFQYALHTLQAGRNPDGTPAQLPYTPNTIGVNKAEDSVK